MLSYKEGNAGITKVLLEGKIVGEIRPVMAGKYFQYFPKGAKTGGHLFPTITAVKTSLQEDFFDDIGPAAAIQMKVDAIRARIAVGEWSKDQSLAVLPEAYDHSHISACAIDLAAHAVIAFGV